jgi:ketosteroid isomerase-like protein
VRMNSGDFEQFMQLRADVARAFVSGDPVPLVDISTLRAPATIFGPAGGTVSGARKVIRKNQGDSQRFGPGSRSRLKIIHMKADRQLAYWVGLQEATVNVKGKKKPVPMRLRVTEIFRLEDGQWKLMHRHADMLEKPDET